MDINVQCCTTYSFVMQIIDTMTFVIFPFPPCFAILIVHIYKLDLFLFIYLVIICSWFRWNGNCEIMGHFMGYHMQGCGNKEIMIIDLSNSSLVSWIQVLMIYCECRPLGIDSWTSFLQFCILHSSQVFNFWLKSTFCLAPYQAFC